MDPLSRVDAVSTSLDHVLVELLGYEGHGQWYGIKSPSRYCCRGLSKILNMHTREAFASGARALDKKVRKQCSTKRKILVCGLARPMKLFDIAFTKDIYSRYNSSIS